MPSSFDLDCSQFLTSSPSSQRYRIANPPASSSLQNIEVLQNSVSLCGLCASCDNRWQSTLQEIAHCVESAFLLLAIFVLARLLQLCQMWFMMERIQNSYSLSERLLRVINRTGNNNGGGVPGFGAYFDDTVEQLIAEGVDLNKCSGNYLPLHCACAVGDPECVEILLKNGADVNLYDGYKRTALHYAAEKSAACVDLLTQRDADVDARDANERTPLHWASYKNNAACVRRLLENGADVDASDLNNDTPLSWAALKGNLETLQMLLEYNCSVETVNSNGSSPLTRSLHTVATGIGSPSDEHCLDLLIKSSGQFELRGRLLLPAANLESDHELRAFFNTYCANARSLQQLSRRVVRRSMGAGYMPPRVDTLPLPSTLRCYVLLKQ